jgi:hypothetical protein
VRRPFRVNQVCGLIGWILLLGALFARPDTSEVLGLIAAIVLVGAGVHAMNLPTDERPPKWPSTVAYPVGLIFVGVLSVIVFTIS